MIKYFLHNRNVLLLLVFSVFAIKVVAQKEYKIYRSKSGMIKAEGNLLNGVEDGLWKYYDEKGRLSQMIHYANGEYHGEFISFYPDSTVKEKG
ncbi:MAG: hypothetical protein KatS3mg034_1389 [Vicingaceae bacterium]|nr:MAG: hypothetical protein KatS3mg034_1389 [Vicingaceae bacterium]